MVQLQNLDAFLAQAQKPIGGAILLPMIYGLNNLVRDLAGRLADWGITTVVWNPYPGHPTIPREQAQARSQTLNDKTMVAQVSAWVTYIQEVRKIRQVATIGFCLGGRVGLLHASQDHRVSAHVSFYPSIPLPHEANQELDVIALTPMVRCPVLLHQPSTDHRTAMETYTKLNSTLRSRHGVPTIIGWYPEAEHGFMELDQHPGHANEIAARVAWSQAVSFVRSSVA
jgi:carboxymethylenebutenolidase